MLLMMVMSIEVDVSVVPLARLVVESSPNS